MIVACHAVTRIAALVINRNAQGAQKKLEEAATGPDL
jgi:hypothetical protein